MSDKWVNTEGAAEHTGFAPSTLEKLRCYGGGPAFAKIAGRSVRYRLSDLDQWMASNVIASTSELRAA